MRIHSNDTNDTDSGKLIYPKLSYAIVGACFEVHNSVGRFAREKQYGDVLEAKLKEKSLSYEREIEIDYSGNRLDFLVEDKIVLELKSKEVISKEDYIQIQRYLQQANKKLGLLVNFRNRFLKPIRVIQVPKRL